MTIRDPEVIELLSDEPELLAIADAVSATQRQHAGWTSRKRLVGAVAIAAAVGGVVAFLLVPQGGPGIVDRALAALGTGPVTHLVAEGPADTALVDLATGKRTVEQERLEVWADPKADRLHLLLTTHGRPVAEFLWPQDKKTGITPRSLNPAFAGLWSGYRTALEKGTAKVVRKGSVDGHAVYWLRFPPAVAGHMIDVAIDRHTYKPILYRTHFGPRHNDQRILAAETIGYDPTDFTRRSPVRGEDQSSTSVLESPGGNTVVRAPWLTAGATVAGLKLGAVNQYTVTTTVGGKRNSNRGIRLVYGPLDQGTSSDGSTTVDELPRPQPPAAWTDIPTGSIWIGTGGSYGPSGRTHDLWVGSLRTHGLYITIKTPVSERALLTIARSLHAAK